MQLELPSVKGKWILASNYIPTYTISQEWRQNKDIFRHTKTKQIS